MSWTLCTDTSAIVKAGVNANSDIVASGSTLQLWSDEAEGMACALTGVDLVDQWGTLSGSNGAGVVEQFCSSDVAQRIVAYDPNSYTTGEYTIILNVLENQKGEAEAKLKDKKFVVDFLGGTV